MNVALDGGQSWESVDKEALLEATTCRRSLRLCVDGGRRSEHQAAVGLALYAVTPSFKYTLLCRRRKLLESAPSAFVAESVALEWALDYISQVLHGNVTSAADADSL